jgi:hypothetical protein
MALVAAAALELFFGRVLVDRRLRLRQYRCPDHRRPQDPRLTTLHRSLPPSFSRRAASPDGSTRSSQRFKCIFSALRGAV